VEYLFFDYNSLIHPAAYQILSANEDRYLKIENEIERKFLIENDIINNCINYTRLIIATIQAKNVYIMIDGVAPRSKMNQQRERRYKSYFFKEFETGKSSLWDSNQITPGTEFMELLTKKLHEQFENVIISDSNEPGEGEHKMMRVLQELTITNTNKILIYGLDSDVIMLSLLNKHNNNIILIRDTDFGDSDSINYLNISELKQYIYKDFKMKLDSDTIINESNFINDYIVICFLLGNDFLDHLFCLHIKNGGVDIVLKAYIKAYIKNGCFLVNKTSSNWKEWLNLNVLKDIMYQLKNYEDYYLKQNRKPYPIKGITQEQINNYNENPESNLYFYNNLYNEFNNPLTFKQRYNIFYNTININDVCFNYIEGLYWILGYYNGHNITHNNWTWYYKYHTIPFCSDLFNYLNTHKVIDIQLEKNIPFTQLQQLSLVLPKYSFIKLFGNKLITKQRDLFPDKLYVDINYKEYTWQSKILFNNINENINILFQKK